MAESLDGRLMSSASAPGAIGPRATCRPSCSPSPPAGPNHDDYAPSADGQRFLVKRTLSDHQRVRMHVVLN